MPVGDICVRDVVIASKTTTTQEAAALMRKNHVGDLIVAEDQSDGSKIPIGIVTDRDVVISVIATRLDPTVYTVGDLLARDLVTASEDEGVFECIQRMRLAGVRRMPVVDRKGALVGIVSVDDLVALFAEELTALSKLISHEQVHENYTKV